MKYVRTTRTVNQETTVVFCQGEMDILAVEELHQAVDPLLEDTTRRLVLELGEVKYVSSSVLQLLIEAQDRMKKKGGSTCLVGASSLVRSAIETARLDSLFGFYETLEALGIAPPAPPPASRANPAREKAAPTRAAPAGRPAEKIFPRPRPERDREFYYFWGGLAVLLAASLTWSLYLYLTR